MGLLFKTDSKMEDAKNPAWRSATAAAPVYWLEQSGNVIRLIPTPSSNVNVTLGYIQKPTDMVNDGDIPDTRIQEFYHDPMKYAACAYLYTLAGVPSDAQMATEMLNKFNALIGVGPEQAVAVDIVDR